MELKKSVFCIAAMFFIASCSNGGMKSDELRYSVVFENKDASISDSVALQNYIDEQGDGFAVSLAPGKEYIFDSTVSLRNYSEGTIRGNGATVKRVDSSEISGLISSNYSGGIYITLKNVPSRWRVGDKIVLIKGKSINEITKDPATIAEIKGNVVRITSPLSGFFPAGSIAAKSFRFFSGAPNHVAGNVNHNIKFMNIIFDGNSQNNDMNYAWTFNGSIYLSGGKTSEIRDCTFKNIPNECLVGHGMIIRDSYFKDLNGSAYHLSLHDNTKPLSGYSAFLNNTVENNNRVAVGLNGHSEGAITFSWGPGNVLIEGNHFISLTRNYGVMGHFYSDPQNGAENIVFRNNVAENYSYIIKLAEIGGTTLNNVEIKQNTFIDCGRTFVPYLKSRTIDILENNFIRTEIFGDGAR